MNKFNTYTLHITNVILPDMIEVTFAIFQNKKGFSYFRKSLNSTEGKSQISETQNLPR